MNILIELIVIVKVSFYLSFFDFFRLDEWRWLVSFFFRFDDAFFLVSDDEKFDDESESDSEEDSEDDSDEDDDSVSCFVSDSDSDELSFFLCFFFFFSSFLWLWRLLLLLWRLLFRWRLDDDFLWCFFLYKIINHIRLHNTKLYHISIIIKYIDVFFLFFLPHFWLKISHWPSKITFY